MAANLERSKNCDICKSTLITKRGTYVATVPLSTETTNKELLNSFGKKSLVLRELLLFIGIDIPTSNNRRFVCLKCARKVVNCYKLFTDLKEAFDVSKSIHSPKKSTEVLNHERSPTGITPSGKRLKSTEQSDKASKRSLDFSKPGTVDDGAISVDEAIQSLMNIDVDLCVNIPPIVKIFVGYTNTLRVLEKSCEDKWESAMVKNICRDNLQATANAALMFKPLRREIIKAVSKEIRTELRLYSKGSSCARFSGDPLSLEAFSNDDLLEEAKERMPIAHTIITAVTSRKTSKYLVNKQAAALSTLLSTWIPRSNFACRINALLTRGCCKSEVMDIFHRLGLCSHPNTIRAQLQSAANHFDNEIVTWKKSIESNRKQIKLLEEVVKRQTEVEGPDSMELCSIDFSLEAVDKYNSFDQETYEMCKIQLPSQKSMQDSDVNAAISTLRGEKLPTYRIVGDNIDVEQSARIQSHKCPNKSLHWFQIYAIKDRVSCRPWLSDIPQKSLQELQMQEFLPTANVQAQLVKDLTNILPRILVQYLSGYSVFKEVVISHIPHQYSNEMTKQSEVCSLGLEFLNSNKAAEMATILKNLHDKFVPMRDLEDGKKEILEQIIFDGDQLTEERARNAQIANVLGDTPYERLSGLETSFADWHLGMNLLEIFCKVFVKEESAATIGTSYASMNRNGKTNAKKGPEKDYNAYKEFTDRETEAHIVAKWMEFAGMNSFEDPPQKRPIPKEIENWTRVQKSAWLYEEVKQFLGSALLPAADLAERVRVLDTAHREGFTCRSPECLKVFPLHSSRVRHEISHHPQLNIESNGDYDRDSLGYYKCRNSECLLVFTTDATRKRHERLQHKTEFERQGTLPEKHTKCKEDGIFNYHNARLQCGLIFLNMTDAIKEGDGERLVRCYKIILLFEYKFNHTKYAFALLLFFAKIYALLSEKEATSLVNNRFVNTKGSKGGNISLDLHMEHLNLDVKKLLQAMGGKLTHAAAQRCARSMTVMNKVMNTVYEECDKSHRAGYHGNKTSKETVQSIATDLLQGKVFDHTPGRSYPSFPNFKSNILDIDYRDFFKWIHNHLKEWKGVYETAQE